MREILAFKSVVLISVRDRGVLENDYCPKSDRFIRSYFACLSALAKVRNFIRSFIRGGSVNEATGIVAF